MRDQIIEKLKVFNDKKFKFDEESHTYTYDGKQMFGVTSFLHRFVKEFDEAYWLPKKAADLGITEQELKKQWDDKRNRSCDLGHNVHTYIETFYESKKPILPKHDEEALERIAKFHSIYESKLKQLTSVGSEIRVFSKRWNLAGTIDKLYLLKKAGIVGDWKTNKKIKTDDDYTFNNYLLPPFNKLKENEINKYSLQISLYRLLLEEAGIDTEYGFVCHLPPEGDAKIYKLKDLRADLRYYLDHQWLLEDHTKVKIEAKTPIIEKLW